MLVTLTQGQLDGIAPIAEDGTIGVEREALFRVLDEALDTTLTGLAISAADCSQHDDGTPEPDTRTVKGIAWTSLGDNRCRKWAFRTDGGALSTTYEGEHRCPISEDADIIARAICAIADQYEQNEISEWSNRLTVTLPSGEVKKARIVVTHDPRVVRPEDVLDNEMELVAYRAGTLGIAIVTPKEDGQALVRKMGL